MSTVAPGVWGVTAIPLSLYTAVVAMTHCTALQMILAEGIAHVLSDWLSKYGQWTTNSKTAEVG